MHLLLPSKWCAVIKEVCLFLSFYVGGGDLNLSPHTCSASPLLTESPVKTPIFYICLDQIDCIHTNEEPVSAVECSGITSPDILQFGKDGCPSPGVVNQKVH